MELALVLEFELAVPLVCTMELIIELCAAEAHWSMCGRSFASRARQLKAVSEDVECVKYVGSCSCSTECRTYRTDFVPLPYTVCTQCTKCRVRYAVQSVQHIMVEADLVCSRTLSREVESPS